MKKTVFTFLIGLMTFCVSAQHSIYFNPSFGPYLGGGNPASTAFIGEDWKAVFGYAFEVGYCYDGQVNAGISYGTLDLLNRAPFLQARTGYTFLERSRFSLTLGGGLGYVFRQNQLIGELDLCSNVHLKPGWDLTIAFANQGVFTPKGTSIGYLPAVNIGFCKNININIKKKKK